MKTYNTYKIRLQLGFHGRISELVNNFFKNLVDDTRWSTFSTVVGVERFKRLYHVPECYLTQLSTVVTSVFYNAPFSRFTRLDEIPRSFP